LIRRRHDRRRRRRNRELGTSTPEWKGNAFVAWSTERHGVNAFVRRPIAVDDEVDIGQGSAFFRPIDSQVTLDAQYTLTLAASAPMLTFGVINATGKSAARPNERRLRLKVHDPRGRMLYAKASFRF
jgi:hypothetical protein